MKILTVLEWPTQPPNLNPIERLWEVLNRHIRTKTSKANMNFFKLYKQPISVDILQRLVGPAVIEAKCGNIYVIVIFSRIVIKYSVLFTRLN